MLHKKSGRGAIALLPPSFSAGLVVHAHALMVAGHHHDIVRSLVAERLVVAGDLMSASHHHSDGLVMLPVAHHDEASAGDVVLLHAALVALVHQKAADQLTDAANALNAADALVEVLCALGGMEAQRERGLLVLERTNNLDAHGSLLWLSLGQPIAVPLGTVYQKIWAILKQF